MIGFLLFSGSQFIIEIDWLRKCHLKLVIRVHLFTIDCHLIFAILFCCWTLISNSYQLKIPRRNKKCSACFKKVDDAKETINTEDFRQKFGKKIKNKYTFTKYCKENKIPSKKPSQMRWLKVFRKDKQVHMGHPSCCSWSFWIRFIYIPLT